jgi:putative phosphoesterase
MTVDDPLKRLEGLKSLTLGILSDTHGWIPPAVAVAFSGVQAIIHAGDMEDPEAISQLERIAPVIGIRGNMDHGNWASGLPPAALVTLGGKTFYILHNLMQLDMIPEAAGIDVVVSGHTHEPAVEEKNGVLFLNPGSAVFPRRGSPAGGFRVQISDGAVHARHVVFDDDGEPT